PRDVLELPVMAAATRAVAGGRVRLQALVAEHPERETRRVIVYRREAGAYRGREAVVAPADVPAVVEALAGGGGEETTRRDVLVCTHGRRDACCGSRGTELFAAAAALSPDPRLRWWRTSHTGGHRFAPTAVLLPEGQSWAYLDPPLLAGVLARAGEVPGRHFRGSAALPTPAVQAVEREAFVAQGWDWLSFARRGWEESPAGAAVTAVVEYRSPAGVHGTYRGRVRMARVLPVPDCGRPVEDATKSEPELRVDSLAHERAED
ncbi:MAG TPA: sucrase ferredoxin, partial [Acidimicrobiales bacterium]